MPTFTGLARALKVADARLIISAFGGECFDPTSECGALGAGIGVNVQGILAHKKQPPPPRASTGHCRVLGELISYRRGAPVVHALKDGLRHTRKMNGCVDSVVSVSSHESATFRGGGGHFCGRVA